ncbi:hypothetical protein [Advenella faeciporci]|uniref:hypothetical protein n=1 Tax=Advenella faeciporci TaxID=797535 RepID=UPI00167AE4EC|nr:hypothetical protein [Advenella faeciporci]
MAKSLRKLKTSCYSSFFRSNSTRVYPKTPGGEKRNEVQVLTIWSNLGGVKKVVWRIGFNDSPGGLKRTVLKIL